MPIRKSSPIGLLLALAALTLTACSDDAEEQTQVKGKDHAWQEKTDSIQKAKDIAEQLERSAEATPKAAESQ